jgi:hypothetical protein
MEGKTKSRVISIRDKIETRPIKEATKHKVFYQYVMTGITQQESKDDVYYIGVVYTVPVEDYPDVVGAYDTEIDRLFPELRDEGGELVSVANGVIERYEVYDINRTNVHVMYRLPCMRKPLDAG